MLFIYRPFFNSVYQKTLRPFSFIIPKKMKIGIQGKFTISLGDGKKINWNTNPTSYLSRLLFWDGVTGFEYECEIGRAHV